LVKNKTLVPKQKSHRMATDGLCGPGHPAFCANPHLLPEITAVPACAQGSVTSRDPQCCTSNTACGREQPSETCPGRSGDEVVATLLHAYGLYDSWIRLGESRNVKRLCELNVLLRRLLEQKIRALHEQPIDGNRPSSQHSDDDEHQHSDDDDSQHSEDEGSFTMVEMRRALTVLRLAQCQFALAQFKDEIEAEESESDEDEESEKADEDEASEKADEDEASEKADEENDPAEEEDESDDCTKRTECDGYYCPLFLLAWFLLLLRSMG